MIERWRSWARSLKRAIRVLYLAARHPLTPWYAKLLAAVVVAYALSPIDLIPDPVPVLGYLDDLVLLPLGLWLTIRLIPPQVWSECEARVSSTPDLALPHSRTAAVMIVALWLVAIYFAARMLLPLVREWLRV